MDGLRQHKKIKCQQSIIKSAKMMFFKYGFEKTTIGIISKHAGIGVGTIYNYFDSKAELYIHIMSELFEVPEKSNLAIVSGGKYMSAVEQMYIFLNTYIDMFEKIDKKTLKEIFSVFFGNSSEHVAIREVMINLDYNMMEKLEKMLTGLVEQGKLEENFAVVECTGIIFSIFAASFMTYIYDDVVDLIEVRLMIKKQIMFIMR